MPEKVLFVDDEINVLSGLKRQFRKQFDVTIAQGGHKGLKAIVDNGPFAVIISDMQMPEMNGVQFLQKSQEIAPDTVRIMLTGNADQKTAVDAVNDGNVFTFLTKPCPPETMANSMNDAVAQYHLIKAERELLEGTLNGSVKLLMDMLSMIAPDSFGRTVAIREMAGKLAEAMQLKNSWNLQLASMLTNISCVTLPPETLAKFDAGEKMSPEEAKMVRRLPEVGKGLINNIPRLEKVSDIIYFQQKNYDGTGFPDVECAGEDIPYESRILKVLYDVEHLKARGASVEDALKFLGKQEGRYDPQILKAATAVIAGADKDGSGNAPVETTLAGLQDGHVLVSNIETVEGKLLMASGTKLTAPVIERLHNYSRVNKIKEPIQVVMEKEPEEEESTD